MTRGPDAAALNNLADAVVGQLPRMLADVYALLEARDADYAAFLAAEYDEVLGAAGHFARRLSNPTRRQGKRRARGRAPCPDTRRRGADRRASGTPWPARRRRAPPRWRARDRGSGRRAAGPPAATAASAVAPPAFVTTASQSRSGRRVGDPFDDRARRGPRPARHAPSPTTMAGSVRMGAREPVRKPPRPRAAAGGHGDVGPAVEGRGRRADHAVDAELRAARFAALDAQRPAVAAGLEGAGAGRPADLHPRPVQGRRAPASVQPRQRRPDRPTSPAAASVSRPSWKTVAARASEASAARAFSVGSAIRSHSASIAAARWPCSRASRRACVGRRVVAVDRTRAARPARTRCATGAGSAAARRRGAAAPAAPLRRSRAGARPARQHRDVEPRPAASTRSAHAEPVEQRAVGGAAAQEDVLAVVDVEVAAARTSTSAPPRRGRASSSVTGAPASAQPSAAAMPGEAAADDDDVGASCGRLPPSARDRDASLLPAGQREPPVEDERRVGRDAVEQPAVDAGHRRHAGGAAPVEQRHAAAARRSYQPRARCGRERDQRGQRAVVGERAVVVDRSRRRTGRGPRCGR